MSQRPMCQMHGSQLRKWQKKGKGKYFLMKESLGVPEGLVLGMLLSPTVFFFCFLPTIMWIIFSTTHSHHATMRHRSTHVTSSNTANWLWVNTSETMNRNNTTSPNVWGFDDSRDLTTVHENHPKGICKMQSPRFVPPTFITMTFWSIKWGQTSSNIRQVPPDSLVQVRCDVCIASISVSHSKYKARWSAGKSHWQKHLKCSFLERWLRG